MPRTCHYTDAGKLVLLTDDRVAGEYFPIEKPTARALARRWLAAGWAGVHRFGMPCTCESPVMTEYGCGCCGGRPPERTADR